MMFSLEKELWRNGALQLYILLCCFPESSYLMLSAWFTHRGRFTKVGFPITRPYLHGAYPPLELREADGWDKSTSWPHTHDGFPAYMNAGIDQCRLLSSPERFIRDVDNKLHRQWETQAETHAHFQWSAELKQKHHNQILFLNVCM